MGQFVPLKLNAQKDGVAAAKRFGVYAWPAILFLEPSGRVTSRIMGFYPPAPFLARMRIVWNIYTNREALLARADSGDPSSLAQLAAFAAMQEDPERASTLLVKAEAATASRPNPDLDAAYVALADLLHTRAQEATEKSAVKGLTDRALALYEKAARHGDGTEEAYDAKMNIALIALHANDRIRAVDLFRQLAADSRAPQVIREDSKEIVSQLANPP